LKKDNNKYSYAILGAGRSGIGIAKLLKRNGAKVFLSESENINKLKYFDGKSLEENKIPFETGGHSDKIYDYDVIIKSPGIPMNSIIITKALDLNKKVVSEIEVAFRLCKAPVIAVTGTNGKTTTTVLTGEIFKNAGYDTKVCGNVGLAFSEIIDNVTDKSIVVLETSSFQLDSIEKFKPKVSMLLNFTPDHIDWHGSLEKYFDAKLKINMNQSDNDAIVFNYDDEIIRGFSSNFKGKNIPFSIKENLEALDYSRGCYVLNERIIYFDKVKKDKNDIINSDEIFIRGKHNLQNSLASISASKFMGVKDDVIKNTLINFKGVEHRIEPVRELNGIKFYNDSKATNFDSTYVALESFPANIVLIMGGKKGANSFDLIKKFVEERVKYIIAIGQTKNDITDYFSTFKKVIPVDTLEAAVNKAYRVSVKGDVVLFSPAYKSFDMFDNFEHRGEEFKNFVNNLGSSK
jgi:UDP-N-acetylmuramoylalanine--D-glutamate ligase